MAWVCLQCTFKNNESVLQCTMCGTQKPHNSNVGLWRCHNCTFENKLERTSCEVCHNPKPHKNGQVDHHHNHNHNGMHAMNGMNGMNADNPLINEYALQNNNDVDNDNEDNNHYDDAFWICTMCTYVNNENVNGDHCALCDGERIVLSTGTTTMGGNYDDYNHKKANDHNHGDHDDDDEDEDGLFTSIKLPQNPQYEDFESVLNIIVAHAPNHRAAVTVLKSLNKITDRVSDEKPKYRVLDTRTRGVQTKLLGFEGSLEYLQLLGYSLDPSHTQLRCLKHPPQHILNKVKKTIELHLQNQREKVSQRRKHNKRNKQQQQQQQQQQLQQQQYQYNQYNQYQHPPHPPPPQQNYSDLPPPPPHQPQPSQNRHYDQEEEEDDDEADLKLDCSHFTLTQLVGLVTHETLNEDDGIRVLLLCHRCFSDSLELIEAIRKRFFVPPPIGTESWTEEQIISWCQNTQRPIQHKCIKILCEWITDYFYVDFYLQPKVLSDLQKFTKQVLDCKYEADDGWYDSLATLLTSALEEGQRQLDIHNIDKKDDPHKLHHDKVDKVEAAENEDDDEENIKRMHSLLKISYDSINDKKQKRNKMNIFKKSVSDKEKDKNKTRLIYEYSAKEIAEQITLADCDYFSAIHAREFLDKVWKGNKNKNHHNVEVEVEIDDGNEEKVQYEPKQPPNYRPNLRKMIDRFNRIHRFVVVSIIYCYQLSSRARVLSHFIDICFHLLKLRNYFSLMAVCSALDSIVVGKLKYCLLRLDDSHHSLLKNLSKVCDPNPNYKALRKLQRSSFTQSLPTIPYIGIILSDLTFVNEGAAKLVEGFINFKRFERFNERINIIEQFQKRSYLESMSKNELSNFIENDINIFNDILNEKCFKSMIKNAVSNDEKNASNAERAQIKKIQKNKKNRNKNRRKNNH